MPSTFFGLEIGKRALYAQQTALYVTSNNVSNENTPGYTRQRAGMQSTTSIPYVGLTRDVSAGQLGTGVEVSKIERLRDEFLDVQYRNENKNTGYWDAKSETYTKLQEIIDEPSDTGIGDSIDQLWISWQELGKAPETSAKRAVVRQRGIAFAEAFNSTNKSLEAVKDDLTKTVIPAKVREVNSIAQQISDLNAQISRTVPNGYEPNDLYDKRDQLLDQLSKLVDINVQKSPEGNGMITVSIGSTELVNNGEFNKVGFDPDSGKLTIETAGIPGSAEGEEIELTGGELLGRIESIATVSSFQDELNSMVSMFAEEVNRIHSQGFNLDDIANVSTTPEGLDFFVSSDGSGDITAANIAVNPEIIASLNKIAASTTPATSTTNPVGNNTNATNIADIKYTTLSFNGSTTTTDDYFQNIIARLGINSQEAFRMQTNSESMLNQIDNRRQATSGVSLDEEMANMIRFQQAYNAGARILTTMDEVLDKVINGMGRVGL